MTQQEPKQVLSKKKSSLAKWIAVVIIVVVVASAIAGVVEMSHSSKSSGIPLAISPTTTGISSQAGTSITFDPGLPSGATFTKLVWNFGNGQTQVVTSGNGIVSYAYSVPGSYLVSLTAYNKTAVISSNNSLLAITVNPSVTTNPASVDGPIVLSASSTGNQTVGLNGWTNLSYGGLLDPIPITTGSQVPGDIAYTIQSFSWNVNNGTQVISDNNTGLPETVNLTFSTSGIQTIDLITTTSSGQTTVNGSYIMTIAVGNYSILQNVPAVTINKQMVVNAEYAPGGLSTLDPAIAYDYTSGEVISEIYQSLVKTNGTSTTQFDPEVASQVPSVANGEVTNNQLNWTFYINTSLQFSNGDHVTPYDVYISTARSLLFSNDPGTPGWTLASGLLPAPSIVGPFNESFYWIHHAVTWNNTTESVTFHFLPTTPTWLPNTSAVYAGQSYGILNQSYPVTNFGTNMYFLSSIVLNPLTDPMDFNWLVQHDAAPQNTSASYAYWSNNSTSPGNLQNWNQYVHYNAMGTGPYMLALYEPATEVLLKVNPYYHATQGMLPQSSLIPEVEIEYLTDQGTAQQQLESGYAQFATGAFPVDSTPTILKYVKQGLLDTATVSSVGASFYSYNFAINVTGAKTYDSKTNIPSNFFTNLSVRKAFSYAFNVSYYVNVSWANSGISYAKLFSGALPPGLQYVSNNITKNYPQIYNLSLATYYWEQTPYYKNGTKLYLPIFNVQGNPEDDQMQTIWANDINAATNGQVTMLPVDVSYTLWLDLSSIAGQNPFPVWFDDWAGYGPTFEYAAPLLEEYGWDNYGDALLPISGFNYTTNPNQWANITKMWGILNNASLATNATKITLDYYKADVIAINLFLYVGMMEPVTLVYFSSAIQPSSLTPTYNPAVGANMIVYYALQYKA